MKRFVWETDVEEIDLGDGDFITIATAFSIKDMAGIGAAENQMDVSISLLRRLVKSWRGPNFERDGQPIPCTPENIEHLEVGVATEISNRIAARVTEDRMDDGERKESIESSLSI